MQRLTTYMTLCVALAVALGFVGCLLEPPRYEGTEFACGAPNATCPGNYVCIEQVCRPESDPVDPPAFDAGVASVPDTGMPVPDAQVAPADAALAPLVTVVLAEADAYDTYLSAVAPDDTHGADRAVRADVDPMKIGLLRFDLSSIPPAAVVESAELVVHISEALEDGELVVHRMLEDWSESEATWNQRSAGTPWATAGAGTGSYDPALLFSLSARDIATYTLPLATVQAWVTQSAQNHGMRWMSTSTDGRGVDFKSSETSQTELRPFMRIQYR